jgi:hypothetical protein
MLLFQPLFQAQNQPLCRIESIIKAGNIFLQVLIYIYIYICVCVCVCVKARQTLSIKIASRSYQGVAKFKYLGTTLTDQNCMNEEMKSKLNSGNACYNLIQSLLCSCLLSRNIQLKIHKTIILPVVLYGCET